jgi:hypothetical protein
MSLVRLYRRLATRAGRSRIRASKRLRATPGIESLELISLLSAGSRPIGAAAVRLHESRDHRHATSVTGANGADDGGMAVDATLQTLPAQTASLGSTLTNFANQPLSPALNLFDPSLGTLVSVTIIQSATLQSNITSQNLSTTSSTVITASLSGSYQINGLNQPIVQPTQTTTSSPVAAGVFGSGTDTVTFPPLHLSQSSTTVFSDPASLAFFTASPGRATVTPTMTATASASASAPNGNLFTVTHTSASSTVSVIYTYLPPSCPTVGTIGRIGVHHQRTLLVVPFNGTVNPTLAGNPGDYEVITPTGKKIPIISADYNPATNSVTLRPAVRLNVHDRFKLRVKVPCPYSTNDIVTVPFGTKYSLIGFHNHKGQFIPVRDGKIERLDPRPQSHRPGPVRATSSRA